MGKADVDKDNHEDQPWRYETTPSEMEITDEPEHDFETRALRIVEEN